MKIFSKGKFRKTLSLFLTLAVIFSVLGFSVPANASSPWTAGTAYAAGDIVSYDGNNYECLQSHAALVGWEPSNVPALWKLYSGTVETVATPTISPAGGNYTVAQSVTLSCTTEGATIRYTIDGSEPTASSTAYTGAIAVSATTTVKAKAFKTAMANSDMITATYTIYSATQVATPTFSPAGGTYNSAQTVSISCVTSDATIRYTTDGSEPTSSSTAYTGPITVSESSTLKAKAFKSGMTDSIVAIAAYRISNTPIPPAGDKLLVGYWHNFDNNLTPIMPIRDVSSKWDVINVAFADIAGDGTVTFTPFNATEAEFISDVAYLRSLGKEIVLSLGGQNGALSLPNSAAQARFTNSLIATIDKFGFSGIDVDIETGISLGAGDTDFRNPVAPTIVNMIASIKDVCANYDSSFVLSMAPEIAYVQGGITAYGGPWGAYLPIIYALRDNLTFIHVQHYNCGGNAALDGRTYNQGTADFQVAMAEMLLVGFPVAGNPNNMFPALRQDQIMVGIPAAVGAAPSGGYINPTEMKKAMDYLINGVSYGGTYTLQNPSGYSGFRGIMTWSINWDAQNNYEFTNNYRPYLDALR